VKISQVLCDEYIRTARRVNAEVTQSLDAERHKIVFAETDRGVTLSSDGDVFALVPWSRVKQVIYAPVEPKAKA